MLTTKIGRRGQITLPSQMRRVMGLQEGDRIALILEADRVIIYPVTRTLLDLRGSVPVSSPQDFESIRKQVKEARSK